MKRFHVKGISKDNDDTTIFMGKSDTAIKIHHVTVQKNGKVTCSDCPSWKAKSICTHSLATEEKLGMTSKFLKWFKAKGLSKLTALDTCDSTKGVGKKGKTSSAIRKGGR